MQGSSSSPQIAVQKFGFLIMAPIAFVMHGALLLVPMGQEQKAKEPEKKEELQPIAAITQLPPIVTSAGPMPKPVEIKSPIVQAQQQNFVPAPIVQQQATQQPVKTPDNSSEVQQLQQKLQNLQNKVQQQTANVAGDQKPLNTSEEILLNLLDAKPCSTGDSCSRTELSQVDVMNSLKKKFETTAKEIKDDNEHLLGYEVKNKKGNLQFIYFGIEQDKGQSGKAVTITKVYILSERITDRKELQARGILPKDLS